MPYHATVYKVLLACPSDVDSARGIAREVVRSWSDVNSEDRKLLLVPVAWDTHSAPSMDAPAQDVINRQVAQGCDLLVAIFWTRLGTPTGTSASGTVEEIEKHLAAGKPAMIYFSEEPVRLDSVEEAQYTALKEFRETCRQRGLIETFSTITEFRDKFSRQLARVAIDEFVGHAGQSEAPSPEAFEMLAPSPLTTLSEEARRLLVEASKDANGIVMRVRSMGGLTVQTNNVSFAERGNPRSEALWQRAIDQLVDLGLIGDRGYKGEVFQITADGYEVAETLSKNA